MNITETMKNAMNVDNCDVLNENGKLRLIYVLDGFPTPLTLAYANSYHELNEKALRIFDAKKWMRFLIDESADVSISAFHPLVADMYKNHHEIYAATINNIWVDKMMEDDVDRPVEDENEDEENETPENCIEVLETGERDNRGHRIGGLSYTDLKKMDFDMLRALGHAFGIEDVDLLGPNDLAYVISQQEIDMDDTDCDHDCENCECGEMTDDGYCVCHYDEDEPEDEDTEDECDGNCENCEYAGVDEREEDEEPTEQPEAQQYEYVNGPAHYHGTECIENMRKLFGDEAVRWFSILSAYKYRFRNGSKPGVSAEMDQEKARWYEDYVVKMRSEQNFY